MPFIEVCTTVMGKTECASDGYLLGALLIELTIYFVLFVLGHRVVLWIKKELND
tara:strand:- start:321 stop:482 length:162 start_codon:yes stop_codon:yes gene_type:complete